MAPFECKFGINLLGLNGKYDEPSSVLISHSASVFGQNNDIFDVCLLVVWFVVLDIGTCVETSIIFYNIIYLNFTL